MRRLYLDERLSVWEVGRRLGIAGQTVWACLRRSGTKIRSKSEACRTYSYGDSLFSTAKLSNGEVYWLGFMYADACMRKEKKYGSINLGVELAFRDRDHLLKMAKFFGTNAPVQTRRHGRTVTLTISCKQVCERLEKLGVYQGKTHTTKFPEWLEPSAVQHFVRGYFDGDGSISWNRKKRYDKLCPTFTISGSEALITKMREAINKQLGTVGNTPVGRTSSPGYRCFIASYEGEAQVRKIMDWMYAEASSDIVLTRKKLVYLRDPSVFDEENGRQKFYLANSGELTFKSDKIHQKRRTKEEVTREKQLRLKHNAVTAIINGETVNLSEAARRLGVNRSLLRIRAARLGTPQAAVDSCLLGK